VGEQKTKPTQASVRELRALGLTPDVVVCRSTLPLTTDTKRKISLFTHVKPENVVGVHDVSNIYRVCLPLPLSIPNKERKGRGGLKYLPILSSSSLSSCSPPPPPPPCFALSAQILSFVSNSLCTNEHSGTTFTATTRASRFGTCETRIDWFQDGSFQNWF
jgi:hypothetical protein